MALRAIVNSLDEVPEGLRGEYVEITGTDPNRGRFRLNVEPVEGLRLENSEALRTAFFKTIAKQSLELAGVSSSLLVPHVAARLAFDESAGTILVTDNDGNARIADGSGRHMTPADLVLEMKVHPDFAGAFVDASHRPAPTGGNPPAGSKKRSEMSLEERNAYVAQHGFADYRKLLD